MITTPFLSWIDTPNARGPKALVAVSFNADPFARVTLRGSYKDFSVSARVLSVDNTSNAANATLIVNGISYTVSSNTRVNFPLQEDQAQLDINAASGTCTLSFYADPGDAPPESPNYSAIIAATVALTVPTGFVGMYAAAGAPSGWLPCDGSAVSRATFSALFGIIGIAYGAGDGVTTFNVPDYRDRVVVGVSPGGLAGRATARAVGNTGGEETHILSIAEMPSHSHTFMEGPDTSSGNGFITNRSNIGGGVATIDATGGGGAHENMPPFGVATYIIKT